jgi:hypothetical protein
MDFGTKLVRLLETDIFGSTERLKSYKSMTSDWTGLPAEFKHIIKRWKRN